MRLNWLLAWLIPLVVVPVAAQSTGTPVFLAPYHAYTTSELGLSLSDPGPGFALEGSYRTWFSQGVDAGIRGGFASGGHRDASLLAGVDGRFKVINHSEGFPLDGALDFGFGVQSGGGSTSGYLPLGLTLGRRVQIHGSDMSFVPYLDPTLTPTFGDASGVAFTIGFGADLHVDRRTEIRFSAGLGDQDGISFTAVFLR